MLAISLRTTKSKWALGVRQSVNGCLYVSLSWTGDKSRMSPTSRSVVLAPHNAPKGENMFCFFFKIRHYVFVINLPPSCQGQR